jgi:hypothetical protein
MKGTKTPSGESSILLSVNKMLPRYGKLVVVLTPLERRLGFLDPLNGWRDARDGSRIEDVRSWYLGDDSQYFSVVPPEAPELNMGGFSGGDVGRSRRAVAEDREGQRAQDERSFTHVRASANDS